MSHAIKDLMPSGRFAEPPEVRIIKAFVEKEYQQLASVVVQPSQIIILVKSAALAGTLRMRLPELKERCQTDKRLVLRIG